MEKEERAFLKHTSTVYRGKSYIARECITGKLRVFDTDSREQNKKSALIAVIEQESAHTGLSLLSDTPSAVAVLFVGEILPKSLSDYAAERSLPLLILSAFSHAHDGKIAILDSKAGTLIVDPDIDTLDRYSRKLCARADDLLFPFSALFPNCLYAIPLKDAETRSQGNADIMLPSARPKASQNEEECFERYCNFSENAKGNTIHALLPMGDPSASESADAFSARLRALLRAAVYGSFSVFFEGVPTYDSLSLVMKQVAATCEELERENREYNRHIPMGVIVDSPLLLSALPRISQECSSLAIDRVCLDLSALVRASVSPTAQSLPPSRLCDAFFEMLSPLLSPLSFPHFARMRQSFLPFEKVCRLLSDCGTQAIFVPSEQFGEWLAEPQ